MHWNRKTLSRLLSFMLILALTAAACPAWAEKLATPTDLAPREGTEQEEIPDGEQEDGSGEAEGEPLSGTETLSVPKAEGDPLPGSETLSALNTEEASETGPAFLKAGTDLFMDENLWQKQGTLAEKAVVLVLSVGEKSVSVCYAGLNEAEEPVKAEGFVALGAALLLTEEEQTAWLAQPHPDALLAAAFPLEPVVFQQAEEDGLNSGTQPARKSGNETDQEAKAEDGETEPAAVNGDANQPQLPADPPEDTVHAEPQEPAAGESADVQADSVRQAAEQPETTLPEETVTAVYSTGRIAAPEETAEAVESGGTAEQIPAEPEGSVTEAPVVFSMSNGLVTANYQAQYENTQLPAVRNQGIWGTCWAFAAIGAMEIDLIKDGADTSTDLSELFLIYFAYHNYPYAKGGGEGDNLAVVKKVEKDQETGSEKREQDETGYMQIGGNATFAYRILANLIGTVSEADAPYTSPSAPEFPTKYTSIAAQLTGAYLIDPSDMDAVKQAILDHGAVGASVSSAKKYYNSANKCIYGPQRAVDHDILLVGWDDTFSKEKFSTPQPAGDGAWKARNSMGGGLPDYFWISYYDASLLSEDAMAYDASDTEIPDFCYSYDKTPYPGGRLYPVDDENRPEVLGKAVVRQTFTVDGSENLVAVGVETGNEKTNVSVSVQIDGKEVAAGSVSADQVGFYQIKLNPAYSVSARTDVDLVVTYQAQVSGDTVYVPYEKVETSDYTRNNSYPYLAYQFTADSGSGGFWFNGEKKQGDARLKLYTKKTASSGPSSVSITPAEITGMKSGETQKLTASASGASLLWYSSDTNAAVVEQDGTVIGGPLGGTAIITAIAANGAYAACKVSVTAEKVYVQKVQIEGFNGAKAYTIDEKNAGGMKIGDTMSISCALTPAYPTDYSVSWTSSNDEVVEVGSQINNRCDIRLMKNGIARITVTVTDRLNKKTYTDYIDLTIYLPVHVTSVSLNYNNIDVWEGDGFQLTATVLPEDAENKTVTWKSTNSAFVTVDSTGYVKGIKDGTAVVTATTVDRGYKAVCVVNVKTKDPVAAFVYRMYRVCLQREPDPEGLTNWINSLKTGGLSGAEMAYGFYYSDEMRGYGLTNEQFVTRAYNGILGREPDESGLAYWTGLLEQGVSWQFIIAGFTNSDEFTNLCAQYGITRGNYVSPFPRDQNPGITAFVSRLYTKMLGRGYDEEGLDYWCSAILETPTKQKALDVALDGFMHSVEFLDKNLGDVEFVKVLYRTFLGREFDAPGLADWVGRLASGQTRDDVAAGFAGSKEFGEIMAAYGLN